MRTLGLAMLASIILMAVPVGKATSLPSICDAPGSANLLTNCGFESGSFSGWTFGGNTTSTAQGVSSSQIDNFLPNSGNDFAYLGPDGTDETMSQTIATTIGQSYLISWYLGVDEASGTTPNDFSVSFGGTLLYSAVDLPATNASGPGTYNSYSVVGLATSALTELTFTFRDDPSYVMLDDTSVQAFTPEPGCLFGLGGILALLAAKFRRA